MIRPVVSRLFCHAARWSLLGGVLVCFALAGCGKPEEKMEPVEGQIQFEGKTLTKGTVIFRPDVGKGNTTLHEPHGSIGASGRYKITTHPRDGAPPGWYKVGVVVTEPSDPKNPYSLPRSLIPETFGKPEGSGLTLEVRSGAPPGAYDLILK